MMKATELTEILEEKILVLDGAMGTVIQRHEVAEDRFRGERFAAHPRDLKGNNDLLCLTQPKLIKGIHTAFLHAGADIIETNTFNATRIAQADYGLESIVRELNQTAARIAHEAVADYRASSGCTPPA